MLKTSAVPTPWAAQSAWDLLAIEPGRSGNPDGAPGVRFVLRGHVDMAAIILRSATRDAFERFAMDRWAFGAPAAGRVAHGPNGGLVWSGPDQWLAIAATSGALNDLHTALSEIAAVSEQGDGRALIEIDGPQARNVLAKGLAIDLHPDVFTAGRTAVTAFEHMSVQIWQERDGSPFTLCVPRTLAGSVWSHLSAAAAEYGYTTERATF